MKYKQILDVLMNIFIILYRTHRQGHTDKFDLGWQVNTFYAFSSIFYRVQYVLLYQYNVYDMYHTYVCKREW